MRSFPIFIFSLLSFITCPVFAEKTLANSLDESNGSAVSGKKVGPFLMMEMQKLQPGQGGDKEIDVLIRTKEKIDTTQKNAIEEKGGMIGSIMGDVLTARISIKAIQEVVDLEFIVYIEKSKKARPR